MSRGALLLAALGLLAACRPPAADLRGGGFALQVRAEDHSRQLKRLRDPEPGEANSPEARKAAIEVHRAEAEAFAKALAESHRFHLADGAPLRLELTFTSMGEVRAKYIAYGIGSGVAWGVGTGLLAHDPRLAVGLGAYELVEESAFWIAGASLFGSYSAPVVLEAKLYGPDSPKPRWEETYYVLNARSKAKALPLEAQRHREVQVRLSMEKAIEKVFKDLEAMAPPDTERQGAP